MAHYRTHEKRTLPNGDIKDVCLFEEGQHYPPAEIARISGMSVNTVYQRKMLLKAVYAPEPVPLAIPTRWVLYILRNTRAPKLSKNHNARRAS